MEDQNPQRKTPKTAQQKTPQEKTSQEGTPQGDPFFNLIPDEEVWEPFRRYMGQWKEAVDKRVEKLPQPVAPEEQEQVTKEVNKQFFYQPSTWTQEEVDAINSQPFPDFPKGKKDSYPDLF